MNMIERVAESQAKFDGRTLISMPRGERERYIERARLAIEAMRDPTPGMCGFGEVALAMNGVDDVNDTDAPECWKGMIDAALQEPQ